MLPDQLNLLSFCGKIKILHMTWLAFFISFVVWFNHAPLMLMIAKTLGMSNSEIKTILLLNVALTIPARIIIGILVDKFGPKRSYSLLLALAAIPCFMFAFANSFEQLALARFLLSFVGAGFVIGIRMVGEWFPPKQVGIASGIYGGLGNIGSAVAAGTLPILSLVYGGEEGWRYAIASTGLISLVYSGIYFFSVSDTPPGKTYHKPEKNGAMEVTSIGDMYFYIFMSMPLYLALTLLTWKLSPTAGVNLVSIHFIVGSYITIALLFLLNVYKIVHINKKKLQRPIDEIQRYKFKQVALLDLAYFITFGSEIAVVSILPLFFFDTFHDSQGVTMVQAGLLTGSFAFINFLARPAGGWISDKFGRKLSLSIFVLGLSIGYFGMSFITSEWSIMPTVLMTMSCSFFVSAGCGAVFSFVPLIKRPITGQIAGMVGAYGNVGGVLFLTLLSFVSMEHFFEIIAAIALFILIALRFIDEPKEHLSEDPR